MPSNLEAMFQELRDAPELFQPSAFWEHYNALNLRQLERRGFQDFKRTLGRNYFSFVPPDRLRDPQFLAMLRQSLARPAASVLRARLAVRSRPRLHALYVAGLWEIARRRDTIGLLDRLDEPAAGNPLLVRHRGRLITEDLCNSALEVFAIVEGLGGEAPGPGGILEIGGGYGRLSWALIEAFPELRCVLVDIPPALAVAERYLAELHPGRRIFRFRHFDDGDDVAEELREAQIAFLAPNQLDMVPPLEVAGVVNVSSFHEMRRDQIAYYLREAIPRHAPEGFLYTKQWKRSENERDGIVVRQEDYPVPESWQRVYERTHPVQVGFFEAFYRVRGKPAPRPEPEADEPERPTLSICIPTHDGRAVVLAELLDSIGRQARPGLEVCVSDNASTDGVADVVAAFRERYGVPTVYSRNDQNLGVGRNIARAVEIASGEFCWLVGSDDHLSADALGVVFRLLADHPRVSGITMPRDNFSPDMRDRLEPDREGFYPDADRTTIFRGADVVLANLGQAFCYLSIHVVRRGSLMAAMRSGLDVALSHPIWPQIYLLGVVADRDPLWLWYPTPLVKARSHRSYLGETGEAGTDLATVHASMVLSLGEVWQELTPAGGAVHKALLRRAYSILAMPDQIEVLKRREDHSLRADMRMLFAFTRRFWRLPEFWRAAFPALLLPYRVVRLRERVRRLRLPRSMPLAREAMRVARERRAARRSSGSNDGLRARAGHQRRRRHARIVASESRPDVVPVAAPKRRAGPGGAAYRTAGPLPPGHDADVTLRVLTPGSRVTTS